MAPNNAVRQTGWVLDWKEEEPPYQVGVYNARNLARIYGSVEAEQGSANVDREFDALYATVCGLSRKELTAFWRTRSRSGPLLHRTEPRDANQPAGSTVLMCLIADGRLEAALTVATASPTEHVVYTRAARFGPARSALHVLASATWPRVSHEEHELREMLRLDLLHVLLKAAVEAKSDVAVPLAAACANGSLPENCLDALLVAAPLDHARIRAAVRATALAGNARGLRWLLAQAANSKDDRVLGELPRAGELGSGTVLAIELAIEATAFAAAARMPHGAADGSISADAVGMDHAAWMREMLRSVCRAVCDGGGAGALRVEGALDFLTAPCQRHELTTTQASSCVPAPPESVLQALCRTQPQTVRWLLDGARDESSVDDAASPVKPHGPGGEGRSDESTRLLSTSTLIAHVCSPPREGDSSDRAWLAHIGAAEGRGLLGGSADGPLGAPLLVSLLEECWQSHGLRMLLRSAVLDGAAAAALTAHLALSATISRAEHSMASEALRMMEAVLLPLPVCLLSVWQLIRAARGAHTDPLVAGRLPRCSELRAAQLLGWAITILGLGVQLAAGAAAAAPVLGVAAALCWLRPVELACGSETGATMLALLLSAAGNYALALALSLPIALAAVLASATVLNSPRIWPPSHVGLQHSPPSLAPVVPPTAALAAALAAALSIGLSASRDGDVKLGARLERLRSLAWLESIAGPTALADARKGVLSSSWHGDEQPTLGPKLKAGAKELELV